jgi:predicted secreted protein
MANPIPLFSKQMMVQFDGSTLGCATDFSLSVNKDFIEIACLNATGGAKQQIPDLYGWTVSFSGLVMQETNETGKSFYELMDNLLEGDESVSIYIVPDVSSNTFYGGTGYISSLSMDGGVGSAVTYSGEIVGTGPLDASTTI